MGIVLPGGPGIRPAFDAEMPFAALVQSYPGLPRIQTARLDGDHGLLVSGAVGRGEDHRGVDRVVSFAEDLRPDGNQLADNGFGRIDPALDNG